MSISKSTFITALGTFKGKQDEANDAKFVAQEAGKGLSTEDYTTAEQTKLSGIAAGAEVNVLESVKVNGTAQTITDKGIDIAVPTKVSDITNDSDFQTGAQVTAAINAKVASTYKAGGTKAAAQLTGSLLVAANEGYVYNLSDALTTTADFVEGAGKTHPAGTNVVVVEATAADGETPATYKFDVLPGFVDLSNLVEKEAGKGLSTEDYTTSEKAQLAALVAADDEQVTTAEIEALFA